MPRKDILKWLVLVMVNAVNAIDITYEQHAQFPKLFHLDDYNDCLGPIDGLYCVGTFHVRSLQDRDPVYELMKEYSLDFNNFNRTLLHRGYCVSSRCRSLSYIRNTTQRFERCAAYYAKRQSLRTMLTQFSYCRSHVEEYASKDISASVEMPHLMFLCILLIFLALNVIGTVYDVMKRDDNKSKLLTSWSVALNWSQLVGPYPDGDPRLIALLPVEAGRVIFLVIVVFVHSGCIHDTLYLANPKYVEEMAHHWITMPLQNGASTIQLFLVLSSFLLAHSLIEMKELSVRVVPKVILKRLFRIVPVYALVIGFAATWWPLTREGPLWHSVVGAETQVCRRKFWAHMFFLHNFFEPERHCLVQTWFLAVDMQLNILGCIITVCLARSKRLALPVLGTAFVASVALTTCLAYINEWKPMMFVSGPENIRHMFQKERSFNEFYTSPLGSLPTMLVGLFLAHLHYQLQETGFKIADHKWIFYGCKMTMPLLLCWTTSGHLLRNFTSREFGAIYIGLERPVPVLMGGALIFGAYNGSTKKELKKITSAETTNGIGTKKPRVSSQGFLTRTFSWRIWYPLGRASLSAMMLHWCVNMMIKASTLQPLTSSALDMVADTLATTFLTYLLAIPITLCVEIPFIKVYSAITS